MGQIESIPNEKSQTRDSKGNNVVDFRKRRGENCNLDQECESGLVCGTTGVV